MDAAKISRGNILTSQINSSKLAMMRLELIPVSDDPIFRDFIGAGISPDEATEFVMKTRQGMKEKFEAKKTELETELTNLCG